VADMKALEAAITPDKIDAEGAHFGKAVISFPTRQDIDPKYRTLEDFQKTMRGMGGTDRQLEVLKHWRDQSVPPEIVSPKTPDQHLAGFHPDASGDMKNGQLTIKKDLWKEYGEAMHGRGATDREFVGIMEKLGRDGKSHTISRSDAADSNAPGGNIVWDPGHGVRDYHTSANAAPQDTLKHEAGHALQGGTEDQKVRMAIPEGTRTNEEERWALAYESRNSKVLVRTTHESNTPYSATDATDAPQTSDHVGLMVHTEAGAKGPIKGPGLHVTGKVTAIEHKDGVATIKYESAGRQGAISWRESVSQVAGDPGQPAPLNHVLDGEGNLKVGDDFSLRIGRREATLANATGGIESKIQVDGRVNSVSKDFTQGQTMSPAL